MAKVEDDLSKNKLEMQKSIAEHLSAADNKFEARKPEAKLQEKIVKLSKLFKEMEINYETLESQILKLNEDLLRKHNYISEQVSAEFENLRLFKDRINNVKFF